MCGPGRPLHLVREPSPHTPALAPASRAQPAPPCPCDCQHPQDGHTAPENDHSRSGRGDCGALSPNPTGGPLHTWESISPGKRPSVLRQTASQKVKRQTPSVGCLNNELLSQPAEKPSGLDRLPRTAPQHPPSVLPSVHTGSPGTPEGSPQP